MQQKHSAWLKTRPIRRLESAAAAPVSGRGPKARAAQTTRQLQPLTVLIKVFFPETLIPSPILFGISFEKGGRMKQDIYSFNFKEH